MAIKERDEVMYRYFILTAVLITGIVSGINASTDGKGAQMAEYTARDAQSFIPWSNALGKFMATGHDSVAKRLEEHGLPKEYAFLPFAMSTLDMGYASAYNAGVWGLTLPVARHYGLRADPDGYDERFDPNKASAAAIRYLADLYKEYNGDFWYTLLAFANSPAELNDAVARNGGEKCSVWEIYSRRMVGNVDIVTRMVALMQTADMCHAEREPQIGVHTERIALPMPLKMADVCESVGLCRDSFLLYNPAIKPTVKYLKPTFDIYLPESMTEHFAACADSLVMAARAEQDSIVEAERKREELMAKAREAANRAKVYRVKQGDTLGHIAARNNVTVTQLKKWNRLRSDMLQIGQTIKIYAEAE